MMLPFGIFSASAENGPTGFSQKVLLSDIPDHSNTTTNEANPRFGFMNFYLGEPFDDVNNQYKLENEWGTRWAVRDMNLKGFLGFQKPGYVTFIFDEDNKLKAIDIFVKGDKRNIAINLVGEFGSPIMHQSDPGRMQNYIWKKDNIAIIYQHDDNEKNVLLHFYPASQVTVAYK